MTRVASWLEALPEPQWIPSGGTRLCARRLSVGGHTVVVLHGGPGLDHHYLLPLAARIAGPEREILLPDLPGHGASAGPRGRPPSLAALRDETLRWLGGLQPLSGLIGHSLGAWLALEAVRVGAVRPSVCVLLAPAVRPASVEEAARSVDAGEPARGARRRGDHVQALRLELLSLLQSDAGAPLSRELIQCVMESRLRSPLSYPVLLADLRRALRRDESRFRPSAPVRLIAGEHDTLSPVASVERLLGRLSQARLAVLPGEGHFLGARDPAPLAALLDELLRGQQPEIFGVRAQPQRSKIR